MATQQVSGTEKTLSQCLSDGEVPRPALMSWNSWQVWRTAEGRRPTSRADGAATTPAVEVQLWRNTMRELYGAEWASDLAYNAPAEPGMQSTQQERVPRPDPDGSAGAATPPATATQQERVPRLDPDGSASVPGAGPVASQPQTPRRRTTEVSPGSVLEGTGAVSPGSGHGSGSWSSREPGTPGTLNKKILESFKPDRDSLDKHLLRLDRQARVLANLNEPLPDGKLEVLKAKAQMEFRLHSEAPSDPERQTRLIKREFGLASVDDSLDDDGRSRLAALEELLTDRGVNMEELRKMITSGQAIAPTPDQKAKHFRIHGTGQETPQYSPTADEGLRKRVEQLELERAAQKIATQTGMSTPASQDNNEMLAIVAQQTELLSQLIAKPKEHAVRSTIRVEPKVHWPRLGDDGPGGTEVSDFFDKFEEICQLANNGTGMAEKEMMMCLRSCLHGSRKRIYENMVKGDKELMTKEGGSEQVYKKIKSRLYRFLETQQRNSSGFDKNGLI